MSGIEANVSGLYSGLMPAECIHGIEEIDIVVLFCTGKIHRDRKLDFEIRVFTAKQIKSADKISAFFVAVSTSMCVQVRVMPFFVVNIGSLVSSQIEKCPEVLRVIRELYTTKNAVHQISGEKFYKLNEFTIRANDFFGPFPIYTFRKKTGMAIVFTGSHPSINGS